jgi:molybdopterin-containing oxidoreductase family iron-sulfur binding subunit
MVIDTARCIGCGACTVACKTENTTPGDVWYAPVLEYETGEYPDARMEFLPVLCNHCEDAPCLKACPTKALDRRDDGIVLFDDDACIGSRACMNACPYGALHFFEGEKGESLSEGRRTQETVPDRGAARRYTPGTVQKCTFCVHRIDFGLEHGLIPGLDIEATPACVVTCPAECRIFGDVEDPDSNVNRYLEERGPATVLRPDAETGAHVFYVDGSGRVGVQEPAVQG